MALSRFLARRDENMAVKSMSRVVSIMAFLALSAIAATAVADDEKTPFRVVVIEAPGGGTEVVEAAIEDIPNLEVRSYDWFVEQVQARAFNINRVVDTPSDLVWVMDGSKIDLVIDIKEESAEDFQIRFIVADGAQTEREFLADRGHDGAMRRGGAALVRFELEDHLQVRPELLAPAPEVDEEPEEDVRPERAVDEADPEAMRRRAAQDREDLKERLSRDWIWLRAHGRWFQKDFSVAARDAVFTYRSGGFFGFELDAEIFPFGMNNPDMTEAGFYATYNHGFYGLVETNEEGEALQEMSVNNLTIEGGALYRLDSPLEESNRQLRFKIGARYDVFSITDNVSIPSTALVSFILGTRLVLPVFLDEFAVTASLDIAPGALFIEGAQFFGRESFTYGFGSELGILYEVFDNGFLSAGYSFRLLRTDFSGDGEPLGGEDNPVVFSESEAFDLNQGLRAGFVYQY